MPIEEQQIEGKIMRKTVYFLVQLIWSVIVAGLVWYFTLANVSFSGNNSVAGIVFVGGIFLYLILSVMYILAGPKWVKDWGYWMIIVNIIIGALMGMAGLVAAIFLPEMFMT